MLVYTRVIFICLCTHVLLSDAYVRVGKENRCSIISRLKPHPWSDAVEIISKYCINGRRTTVSLILPRFSYVGSLLSIKHIVLF